MTREWLMVGRQWCAALFLGAAILGMARAVTAEEKTMSYGEAKAFLARHTEVVELVGEDGARVAVCPGWQGRVMTSSCAGDEGLSFGFVHREFIESGDENPHFNNFGGEDRMWLSPEGGQFSLWFKPGVAQNLTHWFTPPALNEGAWPVAAREGRTACRMETEMRLGNASGSEFHLAVARGVRLLNVADLGKLLTPRAQEDVQRSGMRMVAYETVNTLTNRGEPFSPEKGLVSIWMLGMFNASPRSVIIVPYRKGPESELGPVVKSDYFGAVPPERLKILDEAILFAADAKHRAKMGTSQQRARSVAGSIDFENNVLTLVQFSMPDDPTQHRYLNNMWQLPQAEPFVGDVVNAYNDGPPAPGQKGLGDFYEIESLSPAETLKTGDSLTHRHRTVHIQGDLSTLVRIARETLGVELEAVREAMLP